MPAAAGCQHAGRRERRFFFDPAEEDEAARRIRFASGLVWRQARRVGASLITGHDLKGAAEST